MSSKQPSLSTSSRIKMQSSRTLSSNNTYTYDSKDERDETDETDLSMPSTSLDTTNLLNTTTKTTTTTTEHNPLQEQQMHQHSTSSSSKVEDSDQSILRLNIQGLRGEVPWTKWSFINGKGKFSVYHEVSNVKHQSILHTSIDGTGCKAIKMTRFQFLGTVEGTVPIGEEAYRSVFVDGIKTEAYRVKIEAKFDSKVNVGDIVTVLLDQSQYKSPLRCYVEFISSGKKSMKGILLGGSKEKLQKCSSSSSGDGTLFLNPVLEMSSSKSAKAKTIKVLTHRIISVAPFSMRMLGNEDSDRYKWFQQTESSATQAVCDWSKAIVIVARSEEKNSNNNNVDETNKKKVSSKKSKSLVKGLINDVKHVSINSLNLIGISSSQHGSNDDVLILSPHSYNQNIHGLFHDSQKEHADVYKDIYRKIFQAIRPSAFVDPRRIIEFPRATKHIFSDRPDMCNSAQKTVHHLAAGIPQQPTPRLFASISVKDIGIQQLRTLIKLKKKQQSGSNAALNAINKVSFGLTGQDDDSPWEARLKFSIEVASLPNFDSKTQTTIEHSAVGGSKYTQEHQKAFSYPRHERMDPRLQNTQSTALDNSFSIAKYHLRSRTSTTATATTNTATNNTDETDTETSAAAASRAAILMKLVATEPWDTDPDKIPTIGHDSISWKVDDKGNDPLDSREGMLKLYLRSPVDSDSTVDLKKVISTSFLRVELKVRDTNIRTKQYIVGSIKIPLTQFVNQRWMSFRLDQKKPRNTTKQVETVVEKKIKVEKKLHNRDNGVEKDFVDYFKECVTTPNKNSNQINKNQNVQNAKRWKWQSDKMRASNALKSFKNDPLRSVLTLSGSQRVVNQLVQQAKVLIPESKIYNAEGTIKIDGEIDRSDSLRNLISSNSNSNIAEDSKITKITTISIEKELLRHEYNFPIPSFDLLQPPTSQTMNHTLDECGWQNCNQPLISKDSITTVDSPNLLSMDFMHHGQISKKDVEIIDITFSACMDVCDTIEITPLDVDHAELVTAHSEDGQRHAVKTHNTMDSSLGLSTKDELIYFKRQKDEVGFITVTDDEVHIHNHQNFCQSTSKVQLRSLNNWRRCHAPDEETTKEANQACRILSTDRQICEMCLHRRGISLNASLPKKVAAVNTGAHYATKFCLVSKENKSSRIQLVEGVIKNIHSSDKSVDVAFSTTTSTDHRFSEMRYHVPTSDFTKLNGKSLSVMQKDGTIKFNVGDIIEKQGVAQLVTQMPNGKGYLCSLCFDETHDKTQSSWIELASTHNICKAAVVTLNFVKVRDGDNQGNKDTVQPFDRIEFGRHPLDRSSLSNVEDLIGLNIKRGRTQRPNDEQRKTKEERKDRSESFADDTKAVTIIVHRRSFLQAPTHSVGRASSLLKLDHFDAGLNPDINIVSKIVALASKVAELLEHSPLIRFKESCRFLEYRASDFMMYRTSRFDFRGNLKQALAPLHGLLAMTYTMIQEENQETAILKAIFGTSLDEHSDAQFWKAGSEIIFNNTILFFGDVCRDKLFGPASKRIAHTATSIYNSTVIIGGGDTFTQPELLRAETYVPMEHPLTLRSPVQGVVVFDHEKKTFHTPDIGRLQGSLSSDDDANNTPSLSRMDHTTLHWRGNLIVFGGHLGATMNNNGELVPGEALCDLHLLDTQQDPWSWHCILEEEPSRPKIGRYGHTSIIAKLQVAGLEQDFMVTFGGMQSPDKLLNEAHMHSETYSILSLDEEIDNISWLKVNETLLPTNEWTTKDFWTGNLQIDFSINTLPPNSMAFNWSVCMADRTLIFGGKIKKKHMYGSDRVTHVHELYFDVHESKGTNNQQSLRLLSNAERKMLSGNHHRSAIVNLKWINHKCTGSAPEIGGRCRGAIFHEKLSQREMYKIEHVIENDNVKEDIFLTNQVLAYDSRSLFSLDLTTWKWTQNKTLQEDHSRPVFGSTLSYIGNGELICLGGFSFSKDSVDIRMERETEGFHFLRSPELIMTSTRAHLTDLTSEVRSYISLQKFNSTNSFNHSYDERFFTSNFESAEPTIDIFLQKLYRDIDSPIHFLKPHENFVKVIRDIFDPYESGFVHINTYNSVCGTYGLVRQLIRARLRFEFVNHVQIQKQSAANRKLVWLGEQNLNDVIDYYRASSTLHIWSHQLDEEQKTSKKHNQIMSDMQDRIDWAKFESNSNTLSCTPLVTVELYQLLLLEAFHNKAVSQSDIPFPPRSLLQWALKAVFSKDGGGSHDHLDYSSVRESAADFILTFCARDGEIEIETTHTHDIVDLFQLLSESFVLGIYSRSEVITLRKLTIALFFLAKNHKQRIYILQGTALVSNLFTLRDHEALGSLPQILLNMLFIDFQQEEQIDAGSHMLIRFVTPMYQLVKNSKSSISMTFYQAFKHAMSHGITPFALDTTDHCWQNVVMECPHLRGFEQRRQQVCIDFVQFVHLHTEYIRDLLADMNGDTCVEQGRQKELIAAQQESLLQGIQALQMLKINSKLLCDLSKSIDAEFLQHIKLEIQKRDPDSDTTSTEAQLKVGLISRIAYLKRAGMKLNSIIKCDFAEAEISAKKAMKRNTLDLSCDTRPMRGFMILLLDVLDNILDGTTSLQTAVTVQWRILRVFSYALAAASRKPPSTKITKKKTNDDRDKDENQDEDDLLLFPAADGVTGYAVEFFSHGYGLVTLCQILSNSYQIRILAQSARITMVSTNNASSYQLGYERTDAIYFTQNNHAPERYATSAVMFLLEWLIERLKTGTKIRQDIRKMVRQRSSITVPKLENYSNVAKRNSAWDTILALKMLAMCPSDACCGSGTLIAELASKILECSLEHLNPPSLKLQHKVLDHLKAIQEGTAVLNRGRWESEKRAKITSTIQNSQSEEKWWDDPLATNSPSPYDDENDEPIEQNSMLSFLDNTNSAEVYSLHNKSSSDSRNENCCTIT